MKKGNSCGWGSYRSTFVRLLWNQHQPHLLAGYWPPKFHRTVGLFCNFFVHPKFNFLSRVKTTTCMFAGVSVCISVRNAFQFHATYCTYSEVWLDGSILQGSLCTYFFVMQCCVDIMLCITFLIIFCVFVFRYVMPGCAMS